MSRCHMSRSVSPRRGRRFGHSLRETGQHREAAEQYLEAARLIADDPGSAEPHAFVAADAARELQLSGQDDAALAAYRRAAELFGALGKTVPQVRCQRSAAWIQFGNEGGDRAAGMAVMRAVLESLSSLREPSEELVAEREETVKQLDRMLAIAADEDGPADD